MLLAKRKINFLQEKKIYIIKVEITRKLQDHFHISLKNCYYKFSLFLFLCSFENSSCDPILVEDYKLNTYYYMYILIYN